MSRIIVKQLPKNISEEKLRNLFGSKGSITDLQLKYTPDGKFRQFCFIGYRSEDEANEAIKFYNNTCIQTSRIKVELCAALGAEEKPQSWSKHAKDSKINLDKLKKTEAPNDDKKQKKEKTSKVDEIIGKHKDDPAFQEFIKAHDKHRTLWGNDAAEADEDVEMNKPDEKERKDSGVVDDGVDDDSDKNDDDDNEEDVDDNDDEENDEADEKEQQTKKLAEKPISDLEYMKSLMAGNKAADEDAQATKKISEKPTKTAKKSKDANMDLYTIKIHNFPYKAKRQEVLKFFKPVKPYSVRLPTKAHGFCYVGFRTEQEMQKAMIRNKSFIKGKQVFFSDFTEKNKISKSKMLARNEAEAAAAAGNRNSKWSKQEDSLRNEENISDSGKIFFRNLAYSVTDDDLQKLFEECGPVAEVHLPVDSLTRQIKGFGTVTFVMPEHAVQAYNKLDGSTFHGRLLHLLPGKGRDAGEDNDEVHEAALNFKQKKALKLKKTAQQSVNWNTLFLGANAVAELLSKRFGKTKEQILDTSDGGSSAAVRIALGETQIVMEMKKFLEDEGVCLDAFDATNVKRSKTIILSKNLPADTTVADLTPIFAKFGPIGRLVLPPSGVTALIEYCDATEARQAFKKFAYSKFKNVPLYLEWAPENAFRTTLSGEPIIAKVEPTQAQTQTAAEQEEAAPEEGEAAAEDADEPAEAGTTLFLRNLNFKTVLETVREHFKHLGTIHTIEIAKKRDAENPRQMTSLGYGFIQFKKAAVAEKALKNMQLTNIDGNQVELKRSDRTLRTPDNAAGQRKQASTAKQTGTKILVRNIPFQAKAQEVRDIFKAFGAIRTLRLPTKATPSEDSHRGFGFVDFLTKSDAKKAFEALSQSTHLYGRRLVLEWASTQEDDVEELRKRTAAEYESSRNSAAAAHKRSKRAVFDAEAEMQNIGNDDDE